MKVEVVGTPPVVGESSQFTALATRINGSTTTVTSQATWRSSNTAIVTVNASGLVSAASAGSVDITSTYGHATGTLTFVVSEPVTFRLTGMVVEAPLRTVAVPGATVVARDVSERTRSTVTDGAGAYSLDLPPGPWTVTASAPGFTSVTGSITMSGDRSLNFALNRTPGCPVLGFDDLPGGTFGGYSACGFNVRPTTSNWLAVTTFGRPAPFIQFLAGESATSGEVTVTRGGTSFGFESVDIYSSVTPIPYAITGIANSVVVFSLQSTQPNTFGTFAIIVNPDLAKRVDTLVIRLTNPVGGTPNPVGLDNIRLVD